MFPIAASQEYELNLASYCLPQEFEKYVGILEGLLWIQVLASHPYRDRTNLREPTIPESPRKVLRCQTVDHPLPKIGLARDQTLENDESTSKEWLVSLVMTRTKAEENFSSENYHLNDLRAITGYFGEHSTTRNINNGVFSRPVHSGVVSVAAVFITARELPKIKVDEIKRTHLACLTPGRIAGKFGCHVAPNGLRRRYTYRADERY
jgi:hypothetical protein